MNTEPQIEPVTDDDLYEFEMARRNAKVFTRDKMVMRKHAIEQDRRRVAARQAPEIERLRAEVAEADADYDDAVTLAQLNLAHFRAAEAEVARLTAANGWRPIETAPKDGKRVLLSWPSTLVTVGQISNLRAGAEWPTHWMPLPEPPKENSNG